MKKILHINSCVYRGGGIIKKIVNLIQNDTKNEHVIYFTWYADYDNKRAELMKYLDRLGIKYEYTYHKSIWANIPDFYRYLKSHNYDLLHYYTDNVMVLGKIVQVMGIKTPVVRSFEGFPLYTKFPKKQLINWALTSCKHFVSISRFVEKSNSGVYSSLKEVQKSVVYNAPIGTLERIMSISEREGIVCVGRLDRQKQYDVAIKIIAILKEKYNRPIQLYLVGGGEDKEKLSQLANELNVSDLVKFVGIIDNPSPYYDKARLFLHPAYNEGFGLVIVEAMSMELGVLVANHGALPEIVEDGKTGYVLPVGDAEAWAAKINEIYDNDELLETLGKAAHQAVDSRFSNAMHVKGYDDFYTKALS